MGNTLLTIKEVSRELSLSTRTVHKLIKSNEIPAVKLGESNNSPVRIRRGELDAWLRSKTTTPEEPVA
jgi:excisionase family DNA binding protein